MSQFLQNKLGIDRIQDVFVLQVHGFAIGVKQKTKQPSLELLTHRLVGLKVLDLTKNKAFDRIALIFVAKRFGDDAVVSTLDLK